VASNDTFEGRADNRRVEIVITRKSEDEQGRNITGDTIDIPYESVLPAEPAPETP
jgi:hypothetical protein